MSLTDFIQFASGHNRTKSGQIAKSIQPNMYGLFSSICDDVDKLAEDLTHNPFRPSDTEPSVKWSMWAEKQAGVSSLKTECIARCAWLHAIRDESVWVDTTNTVFVKNAATEGLARAYGLYKLAFLHEIRATDDDFGLTSDLVVRQNYVS